MFVIAFVGRNESKCIIMKTSQFRREKEWIELNKTNGERSDVLQTKNQILN